MTSSSNRTAAACDAIVAVGDRQVGVIRLPRNRVDDFIDHFNRTYQSLGLVLAVPAGGLLPEPIKKSPPASMLTGTLS